MDANFWSGRLSSSSRSYKSALQSRSGGMEWDGLDAEMLMEFEEVDVTEDDVREEFPCPFCSDYHDIVGLCCHIDDEHPAEAKNGVCPICSMRSEVDMVSHITLHHGNIFKMQHKRKTRKGGSQSMLTLLRRELREGNLHSLFGGSSGLVSSSGGAAPDPLLSSFILPMRDDSGGVQTRSSTNKVPIKKNTSEKALERKDNQSPLSLKDQEEKTKRSEFVQGLLLSTIFGNNI